MSFLDQNSQSNQVLGKQPESEPVLVAQGLYKKYDSQFGVATIALNGVSLEVESGTSLAIMGASGSGKTTLLHALAGIIQIDSGNIWLNSARTRLNIAEQNEANRSKLRRENFGFVFQEGLLIPELTAVENAALPLMIQGHERKQAEHLAAGWLQYLGLAGLELRRMGELSGGQRQRVAIARAQVTGAEVIFADEPTGALDSKTSAEVIEALIASTANRHKTLVMVTHDQKVAERCDRIVQLSDGQIIADSNSVIN